DGSYKGGWTNRPNHDKAYPDIAVPMELVPDFSIAAGNSQSVWADIYIPKDVPAGIYSGQVTVSEDGNVAYTVPVKLSVRTFTLPDTPSAKTMAATNYHDVARRYTGAEYPDPGSREANFAKRVMDR